MPDLDDDSGLWHGLRLSLMKASGLEKAWRWWSDQTDQSLKTPFSPTLPDGTEMGKAALGQLGEDLAECFLRREAKMKILRRNFRAPKGGEVDLVCRHQDALVFVEVKTRTSLKFGRPLDAVNAEKQRLITRGAMEWLRLLRHPDILFRFDVVEVILMDGEPPTIGRIANAFELPEPLYYPSTQSTPDGSPAP